MKSEKHPSNSFPKRPFAPVYRFYLIIGGSVGF